MLEKRREIKNEFDRLENICAQEMPNMSNSDSLRNPQIIQPKKVAFPTEGAERFRTEEVRSPKADLNVSEIVSPRMQGYNY